MRTALVFASVLALSSPAFAGFGSSAVAIKAAVQSGSVDAIVAELEKRRGAALERRHRRGAAARRPRLVARA